MTPGQCNSKMWRSSGTKARDNLVAEFTNLSTVVCTNGRQDVELPHTTTSKSSESRVNQQQSNTNSGLTDIASDVAFDYGSFSPVSADYYSSEEESFDETESHISVQCVQEIRANFNKYIASARTKVGQFDQKTIDAINLLQKLRQTKSSLQTYESIMDWHLRAVGAMHYTQSVTDCNLFVNRKQLYSKLRERYNIHGMKNITRLTLPHSKSRATIIWNDAEAVLQSLLSDPRITDEDYDFIDDNPFSPPPNKFTTIGNLNTGRAYRKTYKKLITDPARQVLLPVIFYIDGATTGQFVDLPITAVQISLGIFTRKARDKPHM